MAQQSSRLHRLLTLLDTGSTQETRFAAARQIGDIAKSHPQDLTSLLKKVSQQYLHSKNWDTRVAAAHAIGAIAENVKHTSLAELLNCVNLKISEAGFSGTVENFVLSPDFYSDNMGVSFKSFIVNKVLEFGALLASGGQEYDIANDSKKNPRERLARQKQNLRRRLGLDLCEQFMDVNDMIRDEDLILQSSDGIVMNQTVHVTQNIQQLVAGMVPGVMSRRPSPREINLLKRKAKISSKDQTKGWPDDGDIEASHAQNITAHKGSCPGTFCKVSDNINHDDDCSDHVQDGLWPFHGFMEQLMLDIFDPVWEVRHGSVMALREILTHQGASAGVFMPYLSIGSPVCGELEDESAPYTVKREREIDLNKHGSSDEPEPNLKKRKFDEASSPCVDRLLSANKDDSFEMSSEVDDGGLSLPSKPINGQFSIDSVKVEPESYVDAVWYSSNIIAGTNDQKGCSEHKVSSGKTKLLNIPSENSELMNLVKLARHSWHKNSEFLQDCAIRFLCVLSLDRFGDYVSDQVVAPVRETCAQALGVALKYMHPPLVHQTLNILLEMQCRPEWEIRHGGLLGIKYLVAVRQEMLHELLGRALPACRAGLEDPDDDVRAVAADALIPAATAIVGLHCHTLNSIVMLLWDILLDLDDLSPSTSSVMNLLSEIYSQEEMIPNMLGTLTFDLNELGNTDESGGVNSQENPFMLSTLAPRLWPFMRHSITSVRHSAIRTLERLLEIGYKRSLSEASSTSFWPSFILGDTLRIVFQNLLLESNEEILQCSERVWRLLIEGPVDQLDTVARSYMSSWIELATTPYGSVLDATKIFWPVAVPQKSRSRAAAKMRALKPDSESYRNIGLESEKVAMPQEKFGDTSINSIKIIVGVDVETSVTHTRVVTASALGIFAANLPEMSMKHVLDPLWNALTSLSGVQRQVASMVLIAWCREMKRKDPSSNRVMNSFPLHLRKWLLSLLPLSDKILHYTELSRTYSKMRDEAGQLLCAIESSCMYDDLLSTTKFDIESLTPDDAINLASKIPNLSNDKVGDDSSGRYIDNVESARQRLLTTSGYLKCVQNNLHVSVSALVAASVVWMCELPAQLNPVILPLMASIRREQEEILQQNAAEALAELISHCIIARRTGPIDKLIKKICSLTWMDPCETPQAAVINSLEMIDDHDLFSFGTNTGKQKSKVQILVGCDDRSKVEGFISRRGSEFALRHICEKFGALLFEKLPKLWDCLTDVLKPSSTESSTLEKNQIARTIQSFQDPQRLINNIQVIRSISPALDEKLKPKLLTLLPCLFNCMRHDHVAVRLASSRCITSMARSMTEHVMRAVIENAIHMLGDMTSVSARQGSGMLVSLLVWGLGDELVPYAPLLVVPLLRCMSDCDQSVRQSVTHSFAALVPLLPLARGLPPPAGLSDSTSSSSEDAKFLEQLLDSSHIDDYMLCTDLKVTLRRYQQEGINWLAFLKRFKLHGILCDDMGLGKTLQASAIVASDIVEHWTSRNTEDLVSSLIVCPSTLVGHWAFEIEKYIDSSVISTLQYVGSAQERICLREDFEKHNVIITSYDVIRKDIDHLVKLRWNYCILDEGHIIKNAKSKVTLAVKQLKAQHRLILSGTPIQNNIMDLWSLFDFLMPGFLGTERQFQATYGKPLLASRDPKCSAKDAEAGALAMEALHKQVMPFLLRRTKDEVLSDLPEKIIQDRYCDLSPVQLILYEQFSGSHVRQEISNIVKLNESTESVEESSSTPKASSHVFQAIKYLLKLCSHPLLVLGEKISDSTMSCLSDSELLPANADIISELHKLCHSPKLVALKEIMEECGIGVDVSTSETDLSVGHHRVLIFAQHRAFLDIIERDLFKTHMKSVTYLRLDGSVEPGKRFEIVKAFNSDPTIDALLLTTHVGGLGLNLTSADTLVFMEHDWNPMRDHQAMDRAHRLGQKKVVNVHRLIMRGTLEEKVMSLQRFKISVANAVINADNSSMKTMNTDQLLELFASVKVSRKGTSVLKQSNINFDDGAKLPASGKRLKSILDGLEDLWDQSQYTEYDLSKFMSKLNG